MKDIDRVIGAVAVVVLAAVVLPPAVPAIVTVAVVGTVCFVVIRLVIYYTSRW
jgi:hypothetical protein